MRQEIQKLSMLVVMLGCLSGSGALASDPDDAARFEPHERIREAAEATARAQLAPANSRVEVVADRLDPRVRLAACGGALEVSLAYAKPRSGRVTAEVRCPEPRWKLYVPVRLTVFAAIVVAARPLPRGSLLTLADVTLAERNTGALGYGYLLDAAHAAGHRLRRPLAVGEPITPSMLQTPVLVERGQRVTLEARHGGFTVRMAGEARNDGIQGQVIEVENLSSGRVVQAIVRSAKSAEVLLQ